MSGRSGRTREILPEPALGIRGTLWFSTESDDADCGARDTLSSLPGSGAIKPMPEAQIARAVQLLDLMLNFFAHDGHWTRGSYDDGNGGHCLVGALMHLSRKHR